jgi:hypothetical protein
MRRVKVCIYQLDCHSKRKKKEWRLRRRVEIIRKMKWVVERKKRRRKVWVVFYWDRRMYWCR